MTVVRAEQGELTPIVAKPAGSWRGDRLTVRRLAEATAIHSADFGMSRFRSVLHLATSGRIVMQPEAVCSVSPVPAGPMVLASAAVLVAAICAPGFATGVIVGDTGNRAARIAVLTIVWLLCLVVIAECVRHLVDAFRWSRLSGDSAALSNVAVARRRVGLGRKLLTHVVDGERRWVLSVRTDNLAAIELYRSLGFIEVDRRQVKRGHLAMTRPATRQEGASGRTRSRSIVLAGLAAALVAVAAAVLAASSLTWSSQIASLCSLGLLLRAALIDLHTMRIPNWLIGSAAVCGALANVLAETIDTMLVAGGLGAAPFLLVHLLDPQALGFGDVKFAAAAGLLVAAWWWPAALAMSVATLTVACLARLVQPRGALPMGPSLFVGTCVAVGLSIVLVQKGLIS